MAMGRSERGPRSVVGRAIAPWLAACAVIDAALAVLGASLYAGLPDRLPTHFRVNGTVDAFSDKSTLSVFAPLIGSAALVAVLAVTTVAVFGAQPGEGPTAPDATDAELAVRARLRRGSAGATIGVVCVLVTVLAGLGSVATWLGRPPVILAAVVPALIVALAVIGWIARTHADAVAGVLAAAGIPPSAALARRDRTFRWGMAHDGADRRLLVEKRLGFGYTVNLAHPAAKWVLVGFAAGILVISALPVLLGR